MFLVVIAIGFFQFNNLFLKRNENKQKNYVEFLSNYGFKIVFNH